LPRKEQDPAEQAATIPRADGLRIPITLYTRSWFPVRLMRPWNRFGPRPGLVLSNRESRAGVFDFRRL